MPTFSPKEPQDIIDQLRVACEGHPHAIIPWPHRMLHDAIAEIEKLRKRTEITSLEFLFSGGTTFTANTVFEQYIIYRIPNGSYMIRWGTKHVDTKSTFEEAVVYANMDHKARIRAWLGGRNPIDRRPPPVVE